MATRSRWWRAAFFGALLLVILGGPAKAHSILVSSDPSAGEQLTTTPGLVVLRFSEPLNRRLSRAVLVDPRGQDFRGIVESGDAIDIRVPVDLPGTYSVRWTSVSILDGHTLNGGYTFGVGVAAATNHSGEARSSSSRFAGWITATRFVEDSALLLAVGLLLLAWLAHADPAMPWVRPFPVQVIAVALVAGVASVGLEAVRTSPTISFSGAMVYLTTGLPGIARLLRLCFEAFAFGAAKNRHLAALGLSGALVAVAAGGHAAGVTPVWWGVGIDAVHLLGAALWAGGILALTVQRPPGGWRSGEARALLDRFSPVALCAFSATAIFGVLEAARQLNGLHSLVHSDYGRVLDVKLLAIAAMVVLSFLAWRRVIAPRWEGVAVVVAVGAAVLLSGLPGVPAREAAARAAAEATPADPALPRTGDLTLGGHAGSILVGLTVRPGEPGRNDLFVYLLPLAGEDSAAGLQTSVYAGGRKVALDSCGPPCRRTAVNLNGGERVRVRVGSQEATFHLPALPAPSGANLFQRAEDRMHQLSDLRFNEVFGPGHPPVRSTYSFEAPDRMSLRSDTGFQSIWVGSTRYLKNGPHASWFVQPKGPPLHVPYFVWDYVPTARVDPCLVGHESVGGRRTTVLSFYGPIQEAPAWFRLWIDSKGYVRKAEMRAQGHFMDHHFFDFDSSISIRRPVPRS
ncbi:MAG: copper resistance protein CopC/CopD [Actinomycetota bacterium]|nr:copper resistance protein CopC/CopD [Actinomycetota bacterium]